MHCKPFHAKPAQEINQRFFDKCRIGEHPVAMADDKTKDEKIAAIETAELSFGQGLVRKTIIAKARAGNRGTNQA
ncbi:hypothetical protein P378_18720 [Desulforamulus profundi]|uniref:Uncharacterized protein n=1 Tax=Desulforamulus profundi TaxID=1383067 RepID=A0A2C6MAQ3_9FIRM|nr:hypothetical protein P378_18720 [Desulforamulus profundi]